MKTSHNTCCQEPETVFGWGGQVDSHEATNHAQTVFHHGRDLTLFRHGGAATHAAVIDGVGRSEIHIFQVPRDLEHEEAILAVGKAGVEAAAVNHVTMYQFHTRA